MHPLMNMCLELHSINQNSLWRQRIHCWVCLVGGRRIRGVGGRVEDGETDTCKESVGWGRPVRAGVQGPRPTSKPGPRLSISADCFFVLLEGQGERFWTCSLPNLNKATEILNQVYCQDLGMISVHPALPQMAPAFVKRWRSLRHRELKWPQMHMCGWGNGPSGE